jgi:hypothetical protein
MNDKCTAGNTLLLSTIACLRSSSPGEFHPEALTDPYVNLSIHTAPRSHALASSEACLLWKKRLILVNQLAKPSVELRHPLRSTPITGASNATTG